MTGYKRVLWRLWLSWALVLLTAGLAKLVFYWLPHWELALTHKKVSLARADKVLITDFYKADYVRRYVKPVKVAKAKDGSKLELNYPEGPEMRVVDSYRYFRCQKVREDKKNTVGTNGFS